MWNISVGLSECLFCPMKDVKDIFMDVESLGHLEVKRHMVKVSTNFSTFPCYLHFYFADLKDELLAF